ncbi:MAG: hypothetical protein F6K19_01520 [Cyanothece sp. SIO1E1]|nr:hypothetical protein [Cyanothece sp. SIO1E1]
MKEFIEFLEKNYALEEIIEVVRKYNSPKDFWEKCESGELMLWIASKFGIDEKLLFKTKALCAKTVLHLMEDERSKTTVQATLDYADNKISKKDLKIASDASLNAANKTFTGGYAGYAGYAAARAAFLASDTDYLASATIYFVVDAASYSAAYKSPNTAYTADADARKKNQLATANICREILTDAVMEKVKELKNKTLS